MTQRASVETRVRAAIDSHYDVLWRFLRRLGVEERDVEDAAQMVLVVFASRVDGVKDGAERSFLMGTALRVAADVRKKKRRSREDLGEKVPEAPIAPEAEDRIEERQRRRWLDEVLDALPDDMRAVLVLVDLEEHTMAEAAVVLDVPPGTIASRLRRARELFETHAQALKARIEGGAS